MSLDFIETERAVGRMLRAVDSYRSDARFRMMVDSTVSFVLKERGSVDPERADRDAADIATRVAAILLQRIYEEDAEIVRLKDERDAYKKLAEQSLALRPPVPFVLASGGEA